MPEDGWQMGNRETGLGGTDEAGHGEEAWSAGTVQVGAPPPPPPPLPEQVRKEGAHQKEAPRRRNETGSRGQVGPSLVVGDVRHYSK